MSARREAEQVDSQLPKLKYGFWIAGLFFVSELVWGTQRALNPYSREAGGYAAASTVALGLVGTAFFLHCVSGYHHIVNEVEGWHHPISARKAVRYHFIPLFNLYWNYRWPAEIARFVNWRMQKRRMSGALVGSIVLIGAAASAFLDAAIGLTIIFTGLAYLSRCLRDALHASNVPWEMHTEKPSDYTANLIS
jgi:hypothetical protein